MVCFYRCANITVQKISGYAKGYDYNPDTRFELGHATTHTWNAVHVDGEWRFVDCTWGAGNCDEMKKFHFDYHDRSMGPNKGVKFVHKNVHVYNNIIVAQVRDLVRGPFVYILSICEFFFKSSFIFSKIGYVY